MKTKDNTKEFGKEFAEAIQKALTAIGIEAEGHAKKIITDADAVDTGRLRNSITWATKKQEGNNHSYTDDEGKRYTDIIGSGADDNAVYIGTNVEYAVGIEIGTHRKKGAVHFLKRAATEHSAQYKKLAEEAFKGDT